MAIDLFNHNQKAYLSALNMLEEEGKAAIIHPTGTGKSFIGFQFVDEHPDWNICWISPSDYIFQTQIENVKKVKKDISFENLTFLTYAKLMNMDLLELDEINPTLIILDEFHRAGASEWGKGVIQLLDMYPEAMKLGLSATNIRYLDNQRNMAIELFDNHIASQMTLGEAIVRGILKAPQYVISLYSYEKEFLYYEEKIKKSKNKKIRDEATKYLDALKRALDKSLGLDEIFSKYIKDKDSRYIVFCSSFEHMQEMIEQAKDWFSSIDEHFHVYQAYSSDPMTSQAFIDFKNDQSHHLKLLFCIDMLNEGIHVDDIDGVILLRPTVSPIIYKQQIGRAMSASAKKNPIIFDIVNNFDNLHSIDAIQEEMNLAVNYYHMLGLADEIELEEFEVFDEVKDCMEIFEKLNETLAHSWDAMYELAKEYYLIHGHLLVEKQYRTDDGYPLGQWLVTQRQVFKHNRKGMLTDEQIKKLNDIEMVWDNKNDVMWNRYFASLKQYYEKNHNIDIPCEYISEDGIYLGKWISRLRTYYSDSIKNNILTKERIHDLNELGMIWDYHSYRFDKNYQSAYRFYQKHGHLNIPINYKDEEGILIGYWLRNLKNRYIKTNGQSLSLKQKKMLEDIGMTFELNSDIEWQKSYEYAKAYYQKHGHLKVPVNYKTDDGFALGRWLKRHRKNAAGKTDIKVTAKRKELLDQIGMIWCIENENTDEKYLSVAKKYFHENGHLNVYSNTYYDGLCLGTWLSRKRKLYQNGKLSVELIEQLNLLKMDWRTASEKSWDDQYEKAKAFYKNNGHLQVGNQDKGLARWLLRQRQRYKNGEMNAKQQALLEDIGMIWTLENTWQSYYQQAILYYQKHQDLNIPVSYVTEDGMKLGQWLKNQKSLYKEGNLDKNRQQLLEDISIQWINQANKQWNDGYQYACQYYKEFHNLLVDRNYINEEGFALGEWIHSQRTKYRNNLLSSKQIQQLEQIEMIWSLNDAKWNNNFNKAMIYHQEHGNLDIPTTYCSEDGTRLGAWLKFQRKTYHEKDYPKERYEKLSALGMNWS